MMLRKCALKCNWYKGIVPSGIDSVLLSDFNVSCVLYSFFAGLLVFLLHLLSLFPVVLILKIVLNSQSAKV